MNFILTERLALMPAHRIKEYTDGFKKVEYCSVCGKEGRELIDEPECIVDKKSDDQKDFLIDRHWERN